MVIMLEFKSSYQTNFNELHLNIKIHFITKQNHLKTNQMDKLVTEYRIDCISEVSMI